MEILKRLEVIRQEVTSCQKCSLHQTRKNTVFSRGNPNATLMIIGEGPGSDEDDQGLPFVGRSGKLLNEILEEIGLDVNKDVYIANIVKCRPPGNRVPNEEEIELCKDYLEEQISIVNPDVIVPLGKTATSTLLGEEISITKVRGETFTVARYKDCVVIPTFHPSYVLRGAVGAKEKMKQDILAAFITLVELDPL